MSIVIKGGSSNNVAEVSTLGEIGAVVRGLAIPQSTYNFAAATTGVAGPADVSLAGNITFTIKNQVAATAYTGTPVIAFEQSDDGVSWGPLVVTRADINTSAATHVLAAGTASGSVMFDCAAEGVYWARARVSSGTTTGGMTIVIAPGGMPFSPAVSLLQPARTSVLISGIALATGATGVETLLTLTRQKGTTITESLNSFALPLGKRFRIQSLLLQQVGNATATAATTIFRFRVNPTGAVTTTSTPIMQQIRAVAGATALSIAQTNFDIPDGFDLGPGDGVAQFGITVASTYVLNAPTLDVQITGYEY